MGGMTTVPWPSNRRVRRPASRSASNPGLVAFRYSAYYVVRPRER